MIVIIRINFAFVVNVFGISMFYYRYHNYYNCFVFIVIVVSSSKSISFINY